jgi:RNA polymerase sigma factor (sigma-70 family)
MTPADATCWTLIGAAANGDAAARGDFARRYQPVARHYFAARWQSSQLRSAVDDAVQDVFVECFKPNGVLGRVNESPQAGFRPYFHGVLRNVARRHEERHRPGVPLSDDHAADDTSLGKAFDRAWARAMLQEAARLLAELADDERKRRRVELLRLRFQEGLPIRDIVAKWNEVAAKLHHEYAAARDEFRAALKQVVAFHLPAATPEQLADACRGLLGSLG